MFDYAKKLTQIATESDESPASLGAKTSNAAKVNEAAFISYISKADPEEIKRARMT